ncbi:hypothetical protein EG327_008175 [Venturia inaequalis]|nr:hypothetical protein EG327_008175 [Venturia inaequalis]
MDEVRQHLPNAITKRAKVAAERTQNVQTIAKINAEIERVKKLMVQYSQQSLKLEQDEQEATKLVRTWERTRDEIQAGMDKIAEDEKVKNDKIRRNEELIATLHDLKNKSQMGVEKVIEKVVVPTSYIKPGEYICIYCGQVYPISNATDHPSHCWGRCRRCVEEKCPCDCGTGPRFKPCSNCVKATVKCEKTSNSRPAAHRRSALQDASRSETLASTSTGTQASSDGISLSVDEEEDKKPIDPGHDSILSRARYFSQVL